jgi:hypothetical protein
MREILPATVLFLAASAALPAAEPSLVPDTPSTAPDYFCTWNVQGFACSYSGASNQADMMTEASLFGTGTNQNWLSFYPEVRGDLTFLLDDAFDFPIGGGHNDTRRGSIELDAGRFPSYKGTPAERLAKLSKDVKAKCWRDLGLWICSGIMRHPLADPMPNGKPDRFFRPDFRNVKRRLDEVTRAVRWHRIAQPFPKGDKFIIDTVTLTDNKKTAPARIARGGLPLPTVTMPDRSKELPYVLCSRHPHGEIAVATIGRVIDKDVTVPRADVTLDIGELNRPIGIFGEYGSLTLITTSDLAGKRILAQDLAGNTPLDITREVQVTDGRMTIPGAVIHRVGLMAARPGDVSDPGLVLAVKGLTAFLLKKPMKPQMDTAAAGSMPAQAAVPTAADDEIDAVLLPRRTRLSVGRVSRPVRDGPGDPSYVIYFPAGVIATEDPLRAAQCEAALRAELDARLAERVGPILLTEERFTRKLDDGSVQVSQYWGRAPMQAYPFFDAYDLLGDKKYLRVALDLSQKGEPRLPSEFLMKLRTAQGRFTPEQLAPGAPPYFCGQGLQSFRVLNWFDIPWR